MGKINWYPGHIKTAKGKIKEYLPVVDLILEVVDSRVPISSNILFDSENKLFSNKKRILVFSKTDLVNIGELKEWEAYYQTKNIYEKIMFFSKSQSYQYAFLRKIKKFFKGFLAEKKNKYPYRKQVNLRVMIAGFPNVGKSTVLNAIAGKRKAKVANMPGVTRTTQWYKIEENVYLLDTPGIIFPERISRKRAYKLIFAGIIPFLKGVVDEEILLLDFLPQLLEKYPQLLSVCEKKFGVSFSGKDFIHQLAKNKRKNVEWAARKIFYSFYREKELCDIILDDLEIGNSENHETN